ncbi:MAG: PKD domain-containing protein, partial [Planctomycetes bacterium]|nr:PKD domain-containing protein [Planctomycetota bacterium]
MKTSCPILLATIAVLATTIHIAPAQLSAAVTINDSATGMVDKTFGAPLKAFGFADAKLAVSFMASATTDQEDGVLTYSWDFGDGTTSTSQNVDHVYGLQKGGNRSATAGPARTLR